MTESPTLRGGVFRANRLLMRPGRYIWGRGLLAFAAAWLIAVLVLAVTRGLFTPYDPQEIGLANRLLPPLTSRDGNFYLLGTDQIGRDYLSLLMIGARASIGFGFISAILATGFGLAAGSIAGYVGNRTDTLISRVIDAQMSFPALLFALLILVSVGPSVVAVIFVLAVAGWPTIARLARSLALEIRQAPYVESAKALDGGVAHIIRRHVIPNLLGPVLVYGTVLVASLMLASAGLDFLGLGLQPPETSWGLLVAKGRDSVQTAWWLIALPGLAIFLTALSVNIVAMRLRRWLDATGYSVAFRRAHRQHDLSGPTHVDAAMTLLGTELGVDVVDAPMEIESEAVVDGMTPRAVPPGQVHTVSPENHGQPAELDADPILRIAGLSVDFVEPAGRRAHVVRDVSWSVSRGEVLAIVGESGSGKSVTARTVLGILEQQGQVTAGSVLLDGQDLLALSPSERRRINGRRLSLIQQDAIAALNPVMSVGSHIEETIRTHNPTLTKAQVRERALFLLRQVGIPDPEKRFGHYPFQFSGGMSQRILIAMAVANNPEVLIADEPTTALDVTYQAQIMDLLMELRQAYRMSLVLITHDLGLVAQRADRVIVMYAGMVMESGSVEAVTRSSANPYTQALLRARPDVAGGRRTLVPVPGTPPNPNRLPEGCPFNPRCAYAIDVCRQVGPPTIRLSTGHLSTCHRAHEVAGQ